MTSLSTEIWHSRSLIRKAEARLAYQHAFVGQLGMDVSARYAAIENETLAQMDARLRRLRTAHFSLLSEGVRQRKTTRRPYMLAMQSRV